MDWSDGAYELTAKTLEPASQVVLDTLGPLTHLALLDVGCGTGNAALEAARRDAEVVAIDPAERLLELARQQATEEQLKIQFLTGSGASVPATDAHFDAAVSVFAIIFAPDADAVAAELKRVVKPGGKLVFTAWLPRGPVFDSGVALRKAMMAHAPPSPGTTIPQWHDTGFVSRLFEREVSSSNHSVRFTAASPEAWFDEQQERHPIWRAGHAMLEPLGEWAAVKEKSIAALQAGKAEDGRFDAPGEYVVHVVSI